MPGHWQSQGYGVLHQFQKVGRFEFGGVAWRLLDGLGDKIVRTP